MVSETSSAKRRSLRDKSEVADVDESGDSDEESSGAPEGSVRSAGSESRSATPVPLGRKPTPKLIAKKMRVKQSYSASLKSIFYEFYLEL